MSEPGSGEGIEKRVSNAELLYGAGMSVIPTAFQNIDETITSNTVQLGTTKIPFSSFNADVSVTFSHFENISTAINVTDPSLDKTIADLVLLVDSAQPGLLVLGATIDTYLHEGCGV